MKLLISRVITVLILFTCNHYAETSNAGVKFRTLQDYLIVVSVRIAALYPCSDNDSNTLEFILDTGSNTSIITPETALRLRLQAVDRMELMTANGSVVSHRSYIPHVQLGTKGVAGLEVLLDELSEVRRLDKRIAGILGQNFLSRFNYLLDYRNQRLQFVDDVQASFHGTRLAVELDENCMIVRSEPQPKKSKPLRLLLDSAASNLILFGSKQELALECVGDSSLAMATNTGRLRTETGVLRQLRLANETLDHLPVAFLTTSMRQSADGLLPSSLFRAIFFNNQERYVVLNPRY